MTSAQSDMKQDIPRFEFGENWHDFVTRSYGEGRVEISKQHLLKFLGRNDLKSLEVIDIGCGSGLHSVAALEAGAKHVHSFDSDAKSIDATTYVKRQVGNPRNWTIEQGSVLDAAYMAGLPKYDLVYAWGVLHHTGDVWSAIRGAAGRVKSGGQFYVALYSADMHIDPPPDFWLGIKKRYVSSNWLMRRLIELWYIRRFHIGRNPLNIPKFARTVRDYKENRGMSFMTDQRDWLGGWPMEFVHDQEAVAFVEKLGFKLEKMTTGKANTEFLFMRHN
jgi:2-polyprenyl-6-hydroxyphenyl methylase/3-demethylubiquinone-9 3-methyltransferase